MSGNDLFGRNGGELFYICEPAPDAAIEYGDVIDEDQIARKQDSARGIKYGQIVIGVCCRPCLQHQRSAAKIQSGLPVDQLSWRSDGDVIHELVAQHPAKGIKVELPARRKRARKVLVADEYGVRSDECCVAENMVW